MAKEIPEVDQILDGKDPERRAEIACCLGDKLDVGLTDLERKIAEEIARKLADDTVLMVRKSLAESVRHSRFLPKDIGLKLAYDVEDVAAPFLEVTQIFSEDELCEIAREVGQRCKCAIAGREDLPSAITLALSEFGSVEVAQTLVANPKAELRADALLTLINNFSGEIELFESMAQRISMPPQIANLLISRVGDAAAAKLAETYKLSGDFANPLIEESKLSSFLTIAESASPLDLMALVRNMRDQEQLTPAALLSALRNSSLKFFEAAIALLAGISLSEAQEILTSGNSNQIHELCNNAKIPPSLWQEMTETVVVLTGKKQKKTEGSCQPKSTQSTKHVA